ncbi:MAG TPA: formylglycine-generating enzyme family protein, partial [Leucothrix mucor]|nr:formylglycine-generating enzyme family protein [Leucothrix mucor]
YGEYPSEAVQDPQGQESGEDRVLRGGSWINGGLRVRSAYRDWDAPDDRDDYIGFRFSLRSSKGGGSRVK